MGADIHTMLEIQQYNHTTGEWGAWKASGIQAFPYGYYREDDPLSYYNQPLRKEPLSDRNYTLFALLGDVRNGYGFAGVTTGDPLEPIGDNRGVPDDASKKWRKYVRRWGSDLHSTTYYLLPELIDNPLYHQRLVRTGAVNGLEYERIQREGGTPESWAGSVSGGGTITVTPQQYDEGKRAEPDPHLEQLAAENPDNEYMQRNAQPAGRTYVQYVWEDKLEDSLGELFDAIEVMKRFAPYDYPAIKKMTDEEKREARNNGTMPRDLSRVRLVIGFDN